ncbi:hypothetical protein ACTXT7_006327 [Hymenolepis weldensis]
MNTEHSDSSYLKPSAEFFVKQINAEVNESDHKSTQRKALNTQNQITGQKKQDPKLVPAMGNKLERGLKCMRLRKWRMNI